MTYRSNPPPANPPAPGNLRGAYPPQGARPPQGYPGGGFQPKRRKNRSVARQLLRFFLVLMLVGAVGAGIYIGKTYLDVAPYASTFLNGISVDGIDLSGMTFEKGSAAVRDQIAEKLNSWYVRIKDTRGNYFDVTASYLGISRDPDEALKAAWAIGHTAGSGGRLSIFDLQKEIAAAQAAGYSFSSVEYDADTSKIDSLLDSAEQAAYVEPQNARMLAFNPNSNTEPFTFQQEVVGRRLNTAAVKEEILRMIGTFETGEVVLQPETLVPSTTLADLEQYYALRGRAVTPIDSASPDERNANIKIAFSKINGLILNDGAKFSFNGVVGRRTQANGFYRAYEYNYGELVLGIGGGVCQASTTVYLAAMKAGMDLIDHTPHSQKVSYTDLGMDATVSDTIGSEKDMSFRNNSGGQIFFAAQVIPDPANKKRLWCEVRIYGVDLGSTSYELETEVVKVLQPPLDPVYVDDVDAAHVTYKYETETISEATLGYVVDTYRKTMENGVQIDRKKLTSSTYPARAKKIWVGVN